MVSEQNAGGGESFRPRFQFLSRWPSSSGGGLQSRRHWCAPSTGFHFVFIVPINGMPDFFNSCTRLIVGNLDA